MSACLSFNQFGSVEDVIAIAGTEDQFEGASDAINQGMNLGVLSSLGFANALILSALARSHAVFVHLDAGRIYGPKFTFSPLRKVTK